jgi:hypothetical protein
MRKRSSGGAMWSCYPPGSIQPVPRGCWTVWYPSWSHSTVIRITLAAMTFS